MEIMNMGLFDSIKESIKESYNDFQEGQKKSMNVVMMNG